MVDPIVATFVILALAMVGFVSGRVPIAIVAVGVALALWATGVISLPQALAGFGDPTVIFIATLFVVSEALDATGVTAWAGQQVIGRAGTGRRQLTVVIALMVAVLTAFISLNGAVAALLPVVVVVALNAGIAPSRLLIPLAFSSHAGSLLALTGTPVNVLVSDAAADAGGERFGYFEFALAGLPLLALSIAILVAFGDRLLPDRKADQLTDTAPADPDAMAREFRRSYDVSLDTGTFYTPDEGVAEVMITPRSVYIGRKVFPGMTTLRENLVIIAVRRNGERQATSTEKDDPEALRAGDSLLCAARGMRSSGTCDSPASFRSPSRSRCAEPYRSAVARGAPSASRSRWPTWSSRRCGFRSSGRSERGTASHVSPRPRTAGTRWYLGTKES